MSFRKINKPEHLPPLQPADTEAAKKVLDTLGSLEGIPAEEVLLVGSAAMALYGMELKNDTLPPLPFDTYSDGPRSLVEAARAADEHARRPSERPGDVDFATTIAFARDTLQQGLLSGMKIYEKEHPRDVILRTDASQPLPVELITRVDASSQKRRDKADDRLRRHILHHGRTISGLSSNIRVATPYYLTRELDSREDFKARADLAALHRHQRGE